MDTPGTMHQRLSPLVNYLSQALGHSITLVLSPNMSATVDALIDQQVDLAYLTPVAYLRTREQIDATVLAKALTQQQGTFRLAIISRNDSAIATPTDLKGRRFALGDREALLQRAALHLAGLAFEDFSEYAFLNHRDNVIRAVLHGQYDGGIVSETTAHQWREHGIRIISTSPELPSFNITAAPSLDESTRKRLRAALLALDIFHPGQRAIIKALDAEYTGFGPADDSDYNIIRTMITLFDQNPLPLQQNRRQP